MQEIRKLLQEKKSVRQVAELTGYPRKKVEEEAEAMKRERRSMVALSVIMGVGTLFSLVMIVWLLAQHKQAVTKTNDPATWRPAVSNAISGLMRTFAPDKWLLEQDDNADETIKREIQITKEYSQRLDPALASNSNIPEVRFLKDEFGGKFFTTMFSPSSGISRAITISSSLEEANKPLLPGSMEVCFFPRNAQNHPHIKGELLFYDQRWQTLFIGALDYPDKRWFDALVIHELWHAHMHRMGAASATAPVLSDTWIDEELQAHKLENAVLDNGTKGQYLTTVRIITKSVNSSTLADFLRQLTADRFIQLDKLFAEGSQREGSIRTDQYLITLMLDWLSQHYQGEELERQQREAYRLVSTNF